MVFSSFPSIVPPEPTAGQAWVYILQSMDGTLYIGHTVNVVERLRKHRLGLGSKHTRDHPDPRLVYLEGPLSLEAARAREAQLKRWSRAKKEALITGDMRALRLLSRTRGSRLNH